jgi:hypothetical protein
MASTDAGTRIVCAGDAAFTYLDAGSSPALVLNYPFRLGAHGLEVGAVQDRQPVADREAGAAIF